MMTSDKYVPFEIQSEIIKRVHPVKSLVRFRSVSKQWKSLIESSKFITYHTLNHMSDPHYLLVIGYVENAYHCNYVLIVDDDSFPKHKFPPLVSPVVNVLHMLDCTHGLVYLRAFDADGKKNSVVIWNPSIGKSVSIMLPDVLTGVCVGVCPKTSDPKIVKVMPSSSSTDCWEAEVFTLSTGAWRSISVMNIHLSRSMWFRRQVFIDGVIYWVTHDPENEPSDRIVSFDLISEEFREVAIPDSLAHGRLDILKCNESLVVLHLGEFVFDAWMMMKNGFVKLYSLDDGYEISDVIGFRRNGQPIRQRPCECGDPVVTKLEAYELSTNLSNELGIYLPYDSDHEPPHVEITSYTKSLLLVNYSDSFNHQV